ncbi:MAG: DNA primase [Thermoleophilaceae bacterium]|nr:DNA primase [Thermoleophilaceae bacterium]
MARFTDASLDKLRDSIDMVDLVSGSTELRRAGAQYTGLCPFHDERSPSFSVNPVEKLFYCFGCQAGGDAISFVQQTESLEFADAVEWLADRYGVELEVESTDPREQERHRQRERLFELLDRTSAFYERYLLDSPEAARAREYLEERGFSQEVLSKFRVGFAPSAWDRVFVPALQNGFTEQELLASGLVQKSTKGQGIYDRFRGRVMFPLADARGRIRGFGARALRDGEQPKYLNSSDGPVYSKGRQLFGANHARAAAAKAGRVIVVEGYADVLALHDAGFAESVAIMGTAMTDEQVVELSRLAPRVFLALDADRAGRKAMLRGARVAERNGVELSVVELPQGKDPADVVAEGGGEALSKLLAEAVSVLEFEVTNLIEAADLSSARGKDLLLAELEPVFGSAPESMVKEEQIRRVADLLGLSAPLLAVLRNAKASPSDSAPASNRQAPARPAAAPVQENLQKPAQASPKTPRAVGANADFERTERMFMAMCLALKAVGKEKLTETTDWMLSTELTRELRKWLLQNFDNPLSGAAGLKPELRDAVTEVSMLSERETASAQAVQLGFLQLEVAGLERAIALAPSTEKKRLSLMQQTAVARLNELSAELA